MLQHWSLSLHHHHQKKQSLQLSHCSCWSCTWAVGPRRYPFGQVARGHDRPGSPRFKTGPGFQRMATIIKFYLLFFFNYYYQVWEYVCSTSRWSCWRVCCTWSEWWQTTPLRTAQDNTVLPMENGLWLTICIRLVEMLHICNFVWDFGPQHLLVGSLFSHCILLLSLPVSYNDMWLHKNADLTHFFIYGLVCFFESLRFYP